MAGIGEEKEFKISEGRSEQAQDQDQTEVKQNPPIDGNQATGTTTEFPGVNVQHTRPAPKALAPQYLASVIVALGANGNTELVPRRLGCELLDLPFRLGGQIKVLFVPSLRDFPTIGAEPKVDGENNVARVVEVHPFSVDVLDFFNPDLGRRRVDPRVASRVDGQGEVEKGEHVVGDGRGQFLEDGLADAVLLSR